MPLVLHVRTTRSLWKKCTRTAYTATLLRVDGKASATYYNKQKVSVCQTEDLPSCTWQSECYSEMCTVFWTVCLLTTKHPPDHTVISIYIYVIQVSVLVYTIICIYIYECLGRYTVVQLVETLQYKPEGRGFDSRRCRNFSLSWPWIRLSQLKSGSLNILEPPGPVQGLLYFIYIYKCVCVCVCVWCWI